MMNEFAEISYSGSVAGKMSSYRCCLLKGMNVVWARQDETKEGQTGQNQSFSL
jgi:hypothetical protein